MSFGSGWFLVPLRACGRALPKVTPRHRQRPPPPRLGFHLSAASGHNAAGGGQGAPSPAQQQGPAPQHPFVCSTALHAAARCLTGTKPPLFTHFSGTSGRDMPRSAAPLKAMGVLTSPVGFGSPMEQPGPPRGGTCRRGSRCHQEQTSKGQARSLPEASRNSRGVVQLRATLLHGDRSRRAPAPSPCVPGGDKAGVPPTDLGPLVVKGC